MSAYDVVVGLEVHIQLNTESKAFCGDANSFGDKPNTNVSAVSLAHPGTLPVANKASVTKAIKLGLALGCEINQCNFFDRKHYFYPDLPKGYQITQDNEPICIGGGLEIIVNGQSKRVEIHHIHMEEDAGKNIHDIHEKYSLLDVNRAGTPLLELVTEPCLSSGEEVFEFMAELQKLLRYIGVSDADMEKGSMRCDCNVSVKPAGSITLGERCEVKNLNSKRFARQAVNYEAKRQIKMIEAGQTFNMQTLHFDVERKITQVLREKEGVADYRYFPDPDLPPIHITDTELKEIQDEMPALPWEVKDELINRYQVKLGAAEQISQSIESVALFNNLFSQLKDGKLVSNFIVNQYLPNQEVAENGDLSEAGILSYLSLIKSGKVAPSMAAQRLWPEVIKSNGRDVEELAEDLGVMVKEDNGQLESVIRQVIADNPGQHQQYKNGKKALFGYFMGAVMKSAKGVNPRQLKQTLSDLLSE